MTQSKNQTNQLTDEKAHFDMPAVFVGHGSPMNLIYHNTYTENFRRMGQSLPKPSAILCISAHWQTPKTEIIKTARPKQIFDFHGFPDELYRIQYAPEGSPLIAAELSMAFQNIIPTDNWGLDHGTWSVLFHMYPEQNIPTLQLSLDQHLSPIEHLAVARQLKFLRQSGVLVLGSGNIVHNLRRIDWNPDAAAHSWAIEFEEFVIKTLGNTALSHEDKINRIFGSTQLHLAHPTVEHLLPLIYVLGASDEDSTFSIESKGIQNAAISMASFRFDSKKTADN